MSQIVPTSLLDARLGPLEGFTEITGDWQAPSAEYTVLIRMPTETQPITQPFPVSAGDIIRKMRGESTCALVPNSSNPSEFRITPVYPDDELHYEHTTMGQLATTQESFGTHRPGATIKANRHVSIKLHSPSQGPDSDRPLADLESGDQLGIRRVAKWYVVQQPADKSINQSVIGALGPNDEVGWVKGSEDATLANTTTMLANASIS
jgi:hypothetical protein